MLSLANIYTLYFRLYFRLCICLNKLSINNRCMRFLINIKNDSLLIKVMKEGCNISTKNL